MPARKNYKVIWDVNARIQLEGLIVHLAERYSIKFVEKIMDDIEQNTTYISQRPEMFPSDWLKDDNNGSYRYFNVPALRIAYKINNSEIIILRVRHQSNEPLEY